MTTDEVQGLSNGMTESAVVERLGKPDKINRSDYGSFETAQFVYRKKGFGYDYAYIYFRNRRLESVQY